MQLSSPREAPRRGAHRRRGSYGIDGPYATAAFGLVIAANAANAVLSGGALPAAATGLLAVLGGISLHTTRRGKFAAWADLLDGLGLRGDERVLDLGCGRGAVLLLAAERLTAGRAVGVDRWTRDQSGNRPEATLRNAADEGVADRTEVHTADLTALPFESESFDLVVSSLAIHNIRGRAGRDRAVDEAVRVLRPGGRILIADMWSTRRYRARLGELGLAGISRRSLGWRMWWTGPWVATRLVAATKAAPERAASP